MDFEFQEFMKYLFIAILIAVFLIVRSRRAEKKLEMDTLEPVLDSLWEKAISSTHLETLAQKLKNKDYTIRQLDLEGKRLVVESKGISFFHWGFFFFVMADPQKPGQAKLGVFPKGPNPPTGKRLQKHLDQFSQLVQRCLF